MPLVIRQQIRRFFKSKTGIPIFYICLTSPFIVVWGGGWGGETNVNKVGIEREDYLSSSKKTDRFKSVFYDILYLLPNRTEENILTVIYQCI